MLRFCTLRVNSVNYLTALRVAWEISSEHHPAELAYGKNELTTSHCRSHRSNLTSTAHGV